MYKQQSTKIANDFYNRQVEFSKLSFEKGNLLPRRYVFVLTNLCNLKCSFCFQERKKRSDRMLTNDWINLINQIPKKNPPSTAPLQGLF